MINPKSWKISCSSTIDAFISAIIHLANYNPAATLLSMCDVSRYSAKSASIRKIKKNDSKLPKKILGRVAFWTFKRLIFELEKFLHINLRNLTDSNPKLFSDRWKLGDRNWNLTKSYLKTKWLYLCQYKFFNNSGDGHKTNKQKIICLIPSKLYIDFLLLL